MMKHDEYTPADQLRDRVRSMTVQAMDAIADYAESVGLEVTL